MSELELFGPNGSRKMTVKEIAEATGAADRTVRDSIERCFPGIMQHGKTTLLDEIQVAKISTDLKRAHNVDLADTRQVTFTDLEMFQQTFKIMSWLKKRVEELINKVAIDAPKVEAFDAFIRSDREMSITDAGKHFGFTRSQTFSVLRAHGYLTSLDMPTSRAENDDILSIREVKIGTRPDGSSRFKGQAIVKAEQLDNFRKVLEKYRA